MRDEIENYINNNYDVLQEYPWEKFPQYTTFKHKNNKKWFAIIMNVPYSKLEMNKDGFIDIINAKNVPEMIGVLRKEQGIYPAYHMNKEYWISVLLDGTISKEKVQELIDVSYELTLKN